MGLDRVEDRVRESGAHYLIRGLSGKCSNPGARLPARVYSYQGLIREIVKPGRSAARVCSYQGLIREIVKPLLTLLMLFLLTLLTLLADLADLADLVAIPTYPNLPRPSRPSRPPLLPAIRFQGSAAWAEPVNNIFQWSGPPGTLK